MDAKKYQEGWRVEPGKTYSLEIVRTQRGKRQVVARVAKTSDRHANARVMALAPSLLATLLQLAAAAEHDSGMLPSHPAMMAAASIIKRAMQETTP